MEQLSRVMAFQLSQNLAVMQHMTFEKEIEIALVSR